MNTSRGFTLIELMVVIAIVGILATIVMLNVGGGREQARDAQRVSDLKNLQLTLEFYRDANSGYPDTSSSAENINGSSDTLSTALVSDYVSVMTTEQLSGHASYQYSSSGGTYVLAATLESTSSMPFDDQDGTVLNVDCADPVYCIIP